MNVTKSPFFSEKCYEILSLEVLFDNITVIQNAGYFGRNIANKPFFDQLHLLFPETMSQYFRTQCTRLVH